jgi:hypothetical protein
LADARDQAASQLMPEIRETRGLPSAYHAQWAARRPWTGVRDGADRISGAGAHLPRFSTFITDRLKALSAGSRPVKFAFLLRDGYLPARYMRR